MTGLVPALLLVLGAAPPFPAVVNGSPITEPEVARAVRERVQKTSFHKELTPEQLEKERTQAIDGLVEEELRAQEARRRGLTIPREPIEKLAVAEEANSGGKEKFDAVLAANGIDRTRYLEVIERPEMAKRLTQSELATRLKEPTREEALAHYRANPGRYVVGASVHLQELCVRVDPSSAEEAWMEGRRRAAELRERILKGADFASAAREAKCDRFAAGGGDLGFVHKGSLDVAMEEGVWGLQDGGVTEPVRTIRGWHLLRRVESRPERPVPFADVEKAIRAELREARRKEIVTQLDAGLRAKAKIVLAGKG